MSDTMFEFSLFQDMIFPADEINAKAFKEFCQNINDLETLVDPEFYIDVVNYPQIYTEALEDKRANRDGRFKNTISNTVQTTKDAINIYDQATEGNSRLIKGLWDLMVAAASLALKILNFILNNVSKIPTLIANTLNKISRIPENVVNKIKGNINLYITSGDIEGIYIKVIPCIKSFCTIGQTMANGQFWSTFWKPRSGSSSNKVEMKENDMKLGRQLRKKYTEIQLLEFHPSYVEINDVTREIYFKADGKKLKFHDLNGELHNTTYLAAMKGLITDLEELKTPINDLRTLLGDKYEKTQVNQSFGVLTAKAQREVSESIQSVSKVITIIGNLIRYTQTDINTIRNVADKLAKKDETIQKKAEKHPPKEAKAKDYK